MIVAVALSAIIGGVIQSITGFGAGIVLIVVLANYFSMLKAPAVVTSIFLGETAMLAWKYRKNLNLRIIAVPTAVYIFVSVIAIHVASGLNMSILAIGLGLLLIAISVFFLLFQDKVHIRPTPVAAVICGAISGVLSGLFGIGGPTMGLYLITVTDNHEEYLASIQFCFTLVNVANMITRVLRGIYTIDMFPITVIGLVSVIIGMTAGTRILRFLNKDQVKKVVYAFVGISGAAMLLQHL